MRVRSQYSTVLNLSLAVFLTEIGVETKQGRSQRVESALLWLVENRWKRERRSVSHTILRVHVFCPS